jgi:hypothetical protein
MFAKLIRVYIDHQAFGWDNDSALPVRESAYDGALKFMQHLVINNLSMPDNIAPQLDGSILLEWRYGDDRVLEVYFRGLYSVYLAYFYKRSLSTGLRYLNNTDDYNWIIDRIKEKGEQ